MAFTGAPVVTSLGKHKVRITGLSLAAGAVGTIGLPGDAGADAQLPATFPSVADAAGVTLPDLVRVEVKRAAAKVVAAATAAAVATADAPVQGGAYVQADVEAIRALANALKAELNKVITDVASLRTGAAKDLSLVKGGAPFRMTLTNDDAVNATPALEIDVEYAHSGTR